MHRTETLARMTDRKLVAVLRAADGELLVDAAEALLAGGVELIEITFTVPHADRILEKIGAKLGNRVLLGAGTVLDAETARAAISSGAEFLISPHFSAEIVKLCHRYDKLAIPGALTPTEVITAWENGADIVKIFPSEIGGPGYIKTLRGPFPQVRLMPTGGTNKETAPAFLAAGCCCLGAGSSLVPPDALVQRDFDRITASAREFMAAIQ